MQGGTQIQASGGVSISAHRILAPNINECDLIIRGLTGFTV